MARLVMVSNRVADLARATQAGGVAVVIADVLMARNGARHGLWFGWDGKIEPDDRKHASPIARHTPAQPRPTRLTGEARLATISLSAGEYEDYYLGYANSVLWPVFHNRLDLARFDAGFYRRYLEVNERFAERLAAIVERDDTIWVHDYHLIPVASALRRCGITNPIGFFLHIPVPPHQSFRAIPEARALVEELSAYDLVGLQTTADVANLIRIFEEILRAHIRSDGRIACDGRTLAIEAFPVGIKTSDFARIVEHPQLPHAPQGALRIVGVDRLDYTKGLPQKFAAFGRFLERHPRYRGKVVLTQIAPPTRESVEAYTDIRRKLEALSGKINGMFGDLDWVPIQYIHRAVPRRRLRAIYRSSRIGLMTPLRDGMNLVAKEYVAAQDPADPGVLILSQFAGAAEALTDALIVNPYNLDEIADAIRQALEMSEAERRTRHARLMQVIMRHDTDNWADTFLERLHAEAERRRGTEGAASAPIRSALDRLGARTTAFHLDDRRSPALRRTRVTRSGLRES